MANEHIIQALNSYVDNPDPRYALLLKGKWGSGKTWLVSHWIEEKFGSANNDEVLEPIRVSLYGMEKTEEITNAIDRQVHPFLYSKVANIGKGLLRIAGKVVLRTDFDLDSSGTKDATLTTSLDSLSFLASNDDGIKPSSLKLLIFDDLERSHIPMKQLLGYINYFVEYCSCHVIIVGDESRVDDDESKNTLADFKEKTVGKEFEVLPDVDAAIDSFINELPTLEWLVSQLGWIKQVFTASGCNNLRLLRQCLYDFKLQYLEVDCELLERDNRVMKEMLGCFIVTYCEYKGVHRKAITEMSKGSIGFLFSNDDSPETQELRKLEQRYESEKFGGANLLNASHLSNIISQIERGISLKAYIEGVLKEDQKVEDVINRLSGFRDMEEDDFERDCKELEKSLETGKYRQFYQIGKAIALFSLFEREDLYKVSEDALDKTKATITDLFENEVHDAEVLYRCRNAFWQGINIVENRNNSMRIHNELGNYFNEAFQKKERQQPDKMQKALNGLSNENVLTLYEIDKEATPDHRSPYSMTPILKDQDAEALMGRIRCLTTKNIRQFACFLANHYELSSHVGDGFTAFYAPDKEALVALKEMTDKEIEQTTTVKRWAYQYLQKVLDGCLKRSEGKLEALSYSM